VKQLKIIYQLIKDTVRACINSDMVSQGAALSYYTVFAVAPLFIITLTIASLWFGEAAARRELFGQVNQLVGQAGGNAIQSLVEAASKSKAGLWAACVAGVTLAVAATGVFVQLQNSLNKFWKVRSLRGKGWRNFIRHRLLSFAMVFGIGFLLLVSLVCSAALNALGEFLGNYISHKETLLKTMNFAISLGMITILFTMIFKFLPDVKIAWRDVWLGGFITALLFNVGKYLFGIYIGRSSIASVYGAMGSLIIVLVWVYYSALIFLFGAQFTCIYSSSFGIKPQPIAGAEFI
jgi:membrane protein